METQKGHNYLRCTKKVSACFQPYLREEAMTTQITAALTSASLADDLADWLIRELNARQEDAAKACEMTKETIKREIGNIDKKLDRLTAAYLDSGAFSAAEFRKRKDEGINRKRKLLDDMAALDRQRNLRFEPITRFVNGSKQMKYVAARGDPKELRSEMQKVGSNLQVRDRKLHWTPRGAWKLVVDKGSFAHVNTAREISRAVPCGKTRLYPYESGRRESNPHGHFCPTDFKSVASAIPPRPVRARLS
jgi:hypothetical protein